MEREKSTILAIDDSKSNILALTHILTPEYTVYAAKSGLVGLELAKSQRPDLILLDIIMPDMDGYQVLAELKKHDITKEIPVIFVTGLDTVDDEERGLMLGAADYISKPFNAQIVRLRVRNQLRILEQIRIIERFSMTDVLTQLPNRASIERQMRKESVICHQDSKPLSVIVADIDDFKHVNDTFGHLYGDVILRKVAEGLRDAIISSNDYVARWGGEEFIGVFSGGNEEHATKIAEEMRKNIEEIIEKSEEKQLIDKVTISIGTYTGDVPVSLDLSEFIRKADTALYEAKKTGKNKVISYNSMA